MDVVQAKALLLAANPKTVDGDTKRYVSQRKPKPQDPRKRRP